MFSKNGLPLLKDSRHELFGIAIVVPRKLYYSQAAETIVLMKV